MYEIELSAPQSEFIRLTDKFPLFVAGFGAGKSLTLCVSVFTDLAVPSNVPLSIAIYAPTYDLLDLITIPYLFEFMEEMGIRYTINKSKYIITLPDYGHKIILRSLNNPGRIVGYQVFRSHIDELDTLPEKQARDAWNKVVARNRQKVPVVNFDVLDKDGSPTPVLYEEDYYYGEEGKQDLISVAGEPQLHMNRISAYTTPEGFRFAYNTWAKDPAHGYVMVRASTYSNKHLPPDYIPQLRATYPSELVEAYINGYFVNLIGKAVYPGFSREYNATYAEIDGDEILYVGIDFNVVHGAAVIHVLRDVEVNTYDKRGKYLGRQVVPLLHAVDEIHDSYDTEQTVEILNERYSNNPINIYPDATGSKRTSNNTSLSDIAILRKVKKGVVHANTTNPFIKDRVASWNAQILNGYRDRRYYVNIKKCPNLVNALEQQVWDENGAPDKKSGLDHIVDAGGYCVNYLFGITKPETTIRRDLGKH